MLIDEPYWKHHQTNDNDEEDKAEEDHDQDGVEMEIQKPDEDKW